MQTVPELVVSRMAKSARFLGFGLIILGLIAIFAPKQTGMTIGVVVGILLVVGGVLRTAFAWIAMSWGDAILRFLLGVLAILAGGIMIADPAQGLRVITLVAIAYLIADGVTAILFAIRLPPASGGGWIVLGGVLSIVLGILIWREWPLSGDQAVGILVGIKLIIDGTTMLAAATVARAVGNALR